MSMNMDFSQSVLPEAKIQEKQKQPSRQSSRAARYFAHLVLLVGGFLFLYPLIFSVLAGLFNAYEFASTNFTLFPWPKAPTLMNFRIFFSVTREVFKLPTQDLQVFDQGRSETILHYAPFYLLNSLAFAGNYTVLAVLTSMLGGYAFGRLRWRGRDQVFMVLLALQMFPEVIRILAKYLFLIKFPLFGGNNILGQGGTGLFNTHWVYFYEFCAINVMGTFLVRQSLQRTPIELDEAARVDGAGMWRIIFTILMPLQKPVLAYVALSTAIGKWNDWTVPFFFTKSNQLNTLPGAISTLTALFSAQMLTPNYPLIITMGLITTIPCVLLFAFFQKYMIAGLANAGIKG